MDFSCKLCCEVEDNFDHVVSFVLSHHIRTCQHGNQILYTKS